MTYSVVYSGGGNQPFNRQDTRDESCINISSFVPMMAVLLLMYYIFTGAAAVQVLQFPPSLVLSVGDTAHMSCTVEGADSYKKVLYYWNLNGSTLQNSSRMRISSPDLHLSFLLISAVTPRDTGLYLCGARILILTQNEHSGNGTQLLVTAEPVVALRMEVIGAGRQFLVCEAQMFFPKELNISWSFSLRGLQTQENLTEHENGTYTKISMVEITEELWDQERNHVTCYVQHITRTEKTLYHSTFSESHHYLYALLGLIPLVILCFLCNNAAKKRSGMTKSSDDEKSHMEQGTEERDDGGLHYATIFPRLHSKKEDTVRPLRNPVKVEEKMEYASVCTTRPTRATHQPSNMEDTGVIYATLRMSPPVDSVLR